MVKKANVNVPSRLYGELQRWYNQYSKDSIVYSNDQINEFRTVIKAFVSEDVDDERTKSNVFFNPARQLQLANIGFFEDNVLGLLLAMRALWFRNNDLRTKFEVAFPDDIIKNSLSLQESLKYYYLDTDFTARRFYP
jgi:hypothetical protein